jgi:hypothetical protein
LLVVLTLMLIAVTISTISTITIPEAYAAEDWDISEDIKNEIKAKNDDGRQAIAINDCFVIGDSVQTQDCDASAANRDIVEEQTTEDDGGILTVCKETTGDPIGQPDDFDFTVTGNDPSPAQFEGSENCVDVTIGPGEYTVEEMFQSLDFGVASVQVEGECDQDPNDEERASGQIENGENELCRFINDIE